MSYFAQSPFTQLPQNLYSPQTTGRSQAAISSQVAAQMDPTHRLRSQSVRGTSPNMFDAIAGSGRTAAAGRAARLGQAANDALSNSQWQLQNQNSNEQFGLSMLSQLMNDRNQRLNLAFSSGLLNEFF